MLLFETGTAVVFYDFEVDAAFETGDIPLVKFSLIGGFVGEVPDPLFAGPGPADPQDAFLLAVEVRRGGVSRFHPVSFQRLLVNLDSQSRAFGNCHIAVFHLETLFEQIVFPQLVAGDIRQLGVGQN